MGNGSSFNTCGTVVKGTERGYLEPCSTCSFLCRCSAGTGQTHCGHATHKHPSGPHAHFHLQATGWSPSIPRQNRGPRGAPAACSLGARTLVERCSFLRGTGSPPRHWPLSLPAFHRLVVGWPVSQLTIKSWVRISLREAFGCWSPPPSAFSVLS